MAEVDLQCNSLMMWPFAQLWGGFKRLTGNGIKIFFLGSRKILKFMHHFFRIHSFHEPSEVLHLPSWFPVRGSAPSGIWFFPQALNSEVNPQNLCGIQQQDAIFQWEHSSHSRKFSFFPAGNRNKPDCF